MSIDGHPVEVVEVDIFPHDNADRLEMASPVGTDWTCVVGKGQFKTGDVAVYLPIDSVVSEDFTKKYLAGSKIKLHKNRIRTEKIRGKYSQGLLIPPDPAWQLGQDVSEVLGVTKYEPPIRNYSLPADHKNAKAAKRLAGVRRTIDKVMPKYTKVRNHKYFKNTLEDGETVVITEKIHGTNFRAGRPVLPKSAFTWWERFIGFLCRLFLRREPSRAKFVVGSHNVIKWYKDPVYWGAAEQYGLDQLGPEWDGYVFFGEVYGHGVQELHYGCKPNERRLLIFDIAFVNGSNWSYLGWEDMLRICVDLGLPTVPVLYRGEWNHNLVELADGKSTLKGAAHHREGFVVKPTAERWDPRCGRVIFKRISDKYLMSKGRTEFH